MLNSNNEVDVLWKVLKWCVLKIWYINCLASFDQLNVLYIHSILLNKIYLLDTHKVNDDFERVIYSNNEEDGSIQIE